LHFANGGNGPGPLEFRETSGTANRNRTTAQSTRKMIVLEDNIHCERQGIFETFDAAIAELKRRAMIPFDERPNRAPCTGWQKCGREYEVVKYETSQIPWRRLKHAVVLRTSPAGPQWSDDFQSEWDNSVPDPSP